MMYYITLLCINVDKQLETFAGKKKGQKSGNTKKKNSKSKKPSNRKKAGLSHCGNDLSAKLLSTMEKHKEVGNNAVI